MSDYEHALAKVLDAAEAGEDGPGPLSTGEALMAALALNRTDWLARMGYTIVEAMERIGDEWLAFLPRIARAVAKHQLSGDEAKRVAADVLALVQAQTSAEAEAIDCEARLITYGCAPGYRDVTLTFEVRPQRNPRPLQLRLRIRPQDGEPIVRHLSEAHALAWDGQTPLDAQPGETRPNWLDRGQ